MYRKYLEEHELRNTTIIMSAKRGCDEKAAELIKASLGGSEVQNVPHVFVVLGASVSYVLCFKFI